MIAGLLAKVQVFFNLGHGSCVSASGKLGVSWFIDDRAYSESDVTLIVNFIAEGGAGKSVYSVEVESRGLKLNNMERTSARYALRNMFVPPAFIKVAPTDVGESLTKRLLEKFALEKTQNIRTQLPLAYLDKLSCYLVHDEDSVIVVSHERVKGLEIGESDELGVNEIAEYEVVRAEQMERRLSGRSLIVPGEDVFFYEVRLHETGSIAIRAILPDNTARWTISHEPHESLPGS